MTDTADKLRALRDAANVKGGNERITQFRADFRAVFAYWRACGDMSESEMEQEYAMASKAVREHMRDTEWMDAAMAHFRKIAKTIEAGK